MPVEGKIFYFKADETLVQSNSTIPFNSFLNNIYNLSLSEKIHLIFSTHQCTSVYGEKKQSFGN